MTYIMQERNLTLTITISGIGLVHMKPIYRRKKTEININISIFEALV